MITQSAEPNEDDPDLGIESSSLICVRPWKLSTVAQSADGPVIRTIQSDPPIGDFDLIGHLNVHCVQLVPGISALPPTDSDLDEDAWVDPSTSASPSVSAPHRSPSFSAESIHDDQHANHRPAHDDNGLWASTGRGIRAHNPLIGYTAFLNKQTSTDCPLLLLFSLPLSFFLATFVPALALIKTNQSKGPLHSVVCVYLMKNAR